MHSPSPRITAAAVILMMAAVGLGGLLAQPAVASDVTWTAKPATNTFGADRESYAYTINPGGQVEDGIVVVNHGATPLNLGLAPAKDGKSPGIGGWVHPNQDNVTVEPGESVEVGFVVSLPEDAAPGDYAGGIVTSLAPADEVSIPIRLRVGGALKPSLSVENVRVHYAHTANPIGKGDATVSYTIHNTGNATLSARQTASLSGPFGLWPVRAGKPADSPPLLPGETRKASAPLHGVSPALRLTATVTLVPLLTDAAGSTAPLAATKTSAHALTVPWSLLAIVVLCALVATTLRLRAH